MRGGHNRKPAVLHLFEGTGRPCRLNKNGPRPQPSRVSCPRWLHLEAKKLWRQLAPEMRRQGLLTVLDRAAFAALCQSWARWRQAEEVLAVEGLTKPGHRAVLRKHPLTTVAQQYQQMVKVWCQELGLTPSSRGRISVPKQPEKEDPMGRFID